MDAAGHLAAAEQLAAAAADPPGDTPGAVDSSLAWLSLAHGVMAVAIELGAPHGDGAAGQVSSAST